MITRTTSTTVYRDYEAERREESTILHTQRNWFPVDPEILEQITADLTDSDDSPELHDRVLLSVRADLALCGKVIERLRPASDLGELNPVSDLSRLTLEELRKLVPRTGKQISKYRFQSGGPALRGTIQCGITSVAATESFAAEACNRGFSITAEDGFSSSMLRQIGLNLLAWNYPSLFPKLLRSSKNGEFDQSCRKLFGVTPLSLAREIAKRWNLAPHLRSALESTPEFGRENPLREICELGDLFGKRSQRKLFPDSERLWAERKERLQHLIGTEQSREIDERVEGHLEARLAHLFKEPAQRNVAFELSRTSQPPVMVFQSRTLDALPQSIARVYEPIYTEAKRERRSISALHALTNEAIPASGFSRGVICLSDPDSDALRVTIRIGLKDGDRGSVRNLMDTAAESQNSAIPLLKGGASGASISGAFTTSSHRGVLVLEMDPKQVEDPERDTVLLFRAARECLELCLA